MSDPVLADHRPEAGIAILTLNRPEVLNAINTALIERLDVLLSEAAAAPAVRAVVLAGAGGRAFCSGMDLKERTGMAPPELARQRRRLIGLLGYLHRFPKPTVAAVAGVAMGGGFELALCCDLLVASEDARFALPEVRVGIMPAGGGTHTLTWLVGPARARDLILTGRSLPAAEAHAWGIVARLAPSGGVVERAVALAAEIAEGAPIGLRQAKAAIRRAHRVLGAGLDEEDELYQAVLDSEDRVEGFSAFTEKRAPRFRGR
jgi:enoyl-CoA hydratase/carnithine racemase